MRFRNFYFAFSLLVIIPGLISLALFGLKPSIDFTGGALLELQFQDEAASKSFTLSEELGQNYGVEEIIPSGDRAVLLKAKPMDNSQKDALLLALADEGVQVELLRFETVGPSLGAELLRKTLAAILLVASIITVYVWKQFKDLKFGVSAILAMLHDSLVLLGIFSLLGHFAGVEVDVLFVTALLTTLSFSIHDTIVVYDRIRELSRKYPRHDFEALANAAVLETLGRSINNSMTIIIMLLSLVILGGGSIYWFVMALLVGAITGTYSSTFTAVPLLLLWEELREKYAKKIN
jgi:preprotein translocase subunit SecF